MFSNKPKKNVHVHYSSTTKGGKSSSSHHAPRDSRDSGIGSSSASDRASIGTSPYESPFNSQEIQNQRQNPNALNEALNAANERNGRLEENIIDLKDELKDSNKENRRLRKEKSDTLEENQSLLKENQSLLKENKSLQEKIKSLREELGLERRDNDKLLREKEVHSRSSSTTSNASLHSAPRDSKDKISRRFSTSQGTRPPQASQAPQNNASSHKPPNPFTPLNERLGYERPTPASYASPTPSTASYAPSAVSYATSNISYSSVPAYSHHTAPALRPSSKRSSKSYQPPPIEDGDYHAHPL
ncbi:hypothetical protein HYFRA_00008404 [Hymenoscyphus fraxineus]|uniref:Uncharacterized protein n=1 Tax=Hymenoscyphus fraxineus TaxID=746836 RepID=A0A9N9PQ78_9HELO|nr:hypothetical protein HYFRA_00008404 [Hymenoscyphus fraxineus]